MAETELDLGSLIDTGGSLAAAYLPYSAAGDQMDAIKQMVQDALAGTTELSQQLTETGQFKPFSITTGTGSADINESGGYNLGLSETGQALESGLFGQAQQLMGTSTPTATDLYTQMQAMQSPEQQRQRLELENRLRAQGRLGTQTAMYGGTPEQLAMEKAFQEQATKNLLTAQTLAPQLAGMNIQNIQGLLTAGFTPQAQQLATLTPAAQFSNIVQAGQQGQLEAQTKLGLGGLETEAAGTSAIASLEASRVKALADALGGLFAGSGAASVSGGSTAGSAIEGLIDWLMTPSDSGSGGSIVDDSVVSPF
jgi:hypothetical protein